MTLAKRACAEFIGKPSGLFLKAAVVQSWRPLSLTLIHLIGIPVTNTSVNPARSMGPAVFVGGWAIQQLWLFWVAPIIGAALAGFAYRAISWESTPDAM